ncbi:MAG: radical SAM protein [Nitrospirota bacterium]
MRQLSKIPYYWGRYRNRKLNRQEFKQLKSVLHSFPYIAYIDPTNICPLSCPLCPTGNRSSTHPRGLMSFDTFQKIYDQIGPYLYELHLYNWGEPFVNRALVEMIEYAKRKYDPKIIISSNLAGLSEKRARALVHPDIDLLNVSVDGATQETYGKYRVGGDLKQVLETLAIMAETKKASGLRTPVLRWQFIPMKHNEHEIETARRLAKSLGVEFRIHRVRLNISDFDKKEIEQVVKESEEWMPQNPKYVRLSNKGELENVCKFLWDRVVFNWDGSVVPCCQIYTYEDVFAKSFEVDFASIWNGSAYTKAREIFIGKRAEDNFICQKCVDNKSAF